jgi:DNA-binding protein H-NS
MAKTFAQITQEIEALKIKAETARQKEIAGVVERMKKAISFYGLTIEDLGLSAKSAGSGVAAKGTMKRKMSKSADTSAKYRDSDGNEWVGRGPRPKWLRAALAAGQSLESFAVDADSSGAMADSEEVAPKGTRKSRKTAKSKKRAPVAKYKDDAGHSWSGRGPKPGWFKDALAAGKSLAQLAA